MDMNKSALFAPLPRRAKSALLATAAFAAVSGAIANAQENTGPQAELRFRNDYFGYGLSVGPRVTYTDNIALRDDPFKEDEIAASVSTNGSAIYTNNRFTGIIDGSLDVSYLVDQGEVVASQDVGAVGTVTAVENLFYVDIAGSTSRQLAGENARFSQNINAARGQRVNVHNIALSPYFNRRFANGSAAELRYRISQVFIENDNSFNNFNNDSRTQEGVATYNTGRAFEQFRFGLTGYANKTREYGSSVIQDFEFEQLSGAADAQLNLSERFALTGAIGYDDVETTAPAGFIPADVLTGVFWRAGFRAQPGRKTDLQLEYGRRYDDDFINGRLSYDVSDRISVSASASRSFRTRAQAVSSQFEALQRRTLDFVEQLKEGGEGDAASIIDALTRVNRTRFDAQTIGFGVANDADLRIAADYERTTFTAYAGYNDTDYGFRQFTSYGAGLAVQRALSRRASAYGNLFYRFVDSTTDLTTCIGSPSLFGFDTAVPGFDPVTACGTLVANEGKTNTVGARLGMSYRVYQNVSAFGEYSHTERFSENSLLEYGENTFTAGVQVEF